MNLYKDIPTFADEKSGILNMVIDIPKESRNKYEYDEEEGYFKLDRVLHHSMFYPFDYGFIPQTTEPDGDGTDVILLTTYPTFTGCVVKVRLIGVIDTEDEKGHDPKLIAVPISDIDPRWDEYISVKDIPNHTQNELKLFFKEYKKLEKEKYEQITIKGFGTREEAYSIIEKAQKRYIEKHT
ncbi:MAG: inorganic diphosphatase [candidate division SR1 bacterium]|nr:MAG: inorganic diphosphatase [candidate division SR1 bacterium]